MHSDPWGGLGTLLQFVVLLNALTFIFFIYRICTPINRNEETRGTFWQEYFYTTLNRKSYFLRMVGINLITYIVWRMAAAELLTSPGLWFLMLAFFLCVLNPILRLSFAVRRAHHIGLSTKKIIAISFLAVGLVPFNEFIFVVSTIANLFLIFWSGKKAPPSTEPAHE